MQKDLTITELSKLFDSSPHTIRFYEKEGLLTSVSRTEGGVRRYDMEAISELSSIIILRDSGIALKEIKALWEEYTDEKYSEMLHKSYGIVCDEIQRLRHIQKRLKQSIDFRESYIHGHIELREYEDIFLMPIGKYDEAIYTCPKALYDFNTQYKNVLHEHNNDILYLTEIDNQLYLCKRERRCKKTTKTFEKGIYLHYQFTGLLTYEQMSQAKEDIRNYVKAKAIEIVDEPIIRVSDMTSVAIGDPKNEIIEILYRLVNNANKKF